MVILTRRLSWVVLVASSALGCGGAAAGGAAKATASEAAGDPSEARCLSIAGAARARKPGEPARIGVKHLLVRYEGAKGAPATTSRSRGQACLRAAEALTKLKEGMPFEDAVKAYSEEPGAASREGSLGAVERKDLVPPFADAAFELSRGEVSDVVETPFGFHVILRTE